MKCLVTRYNYIQTNALSFSHIKMLLYLWILLLFLKDEQTHTMENLGAVAIKSNNFFWWTL